METARRFPGADVSVGRTVDGTADVWISTSSDPRHGQGHTHIVANNNGPSAVLNMMLWGNVCGPEDDDSGEEAAASLTAREMEIAALVAEGLSNQQIAKRLVISVRTVDTHLQSVYAKTGVHNRVLLANLITSVTPAQPPSKKLGFRAGCSPAAVGSGNDGDPPTCRARRRGVSFIMCSL
jgi:DNA-binding CsgD family transcriptional regulator